MLILLASFFLTLDQVSKILIRQNLAVGEAWAPIPALSKIFTVTHVQNTGVAFGQLPGLGWLFMLVNLAVLIAIVVLYPRIPRDQWQLRLSAALILAGDLGNVIDRLRTGLLAAQRWVSCIAWWAVLRSTVEGTHWSRTIMMSLPIARWVEMLSSGLRTMVRPSR